MNADESDDDIRDWKWEPFTSTINTIKKNTYDTVLDATQDPEAAFLIPRWTRPNWPREGVTLPPEEVVPQDGATAVIKGDATSRLRPALLPEDRAQNPTRYALRYGIFPDGDFRGPRHGRSRMSPIAEAFEHEFQNLDQDPASYSHANIALFKSKFGEEEVYADDEDYQRALFYGFTTKERIDWKAEPLHPDFEPQESNLSGNLHDLLVRDQKWLNMDEGGRPRYNLCGKTGEYSVNDEELWTVLQPALQLVTRVLQMDHPFWRACLDSLCGIEVPPHRKSKKHKDKKLIYIDPNEPKDWFAKQGTHMRANLALSYIQERISLSIKSNRQFVAGQGPGRDDMTGETQPYHRNDAVNFRLEVAIAAEIMWPLLVPQYTIVEKQNCSLVIATVILHELAHAAHFAMYGHVADTLNPEVRRAWDDPFWANEGKAEIGFAFENQLWGGTLKPPHKTDIARFYPYRTWPIDICLWQWPDPPDHKDHENRADYLRDAVLPTARVGTLIQLKDVHRLFQQSFWDANVPIYGHRALRFTTAGRPSFAVPHDAELRKQDWYETFGFSKGRWLHLAVRAFRAAGYGMVAEYLGHLVDEELVGVRTKSRWDEEKKRWSGRDADVKAHMEKIRNNALSSMPGEAAVSVTQLNARSTTQELLSALQDFCSSVLAELQHSQRMAVEYLQLSDFDKSYLQVQLWKLQQRIESYGRKVHRIMSLSLPAKITRWMSIVFLDNQLLSSISESITSITLLFSSLKQTRAYLEKNTISQREFDEIAKTMPSIADTVFRTRSQRLQNIAQRELFSMPLMFRQVWEKFHVIFGRISTKLRTGTLRVRPYIMKKKRKKQKKKNARRQSSPGTDYDSELSLSRLTLRSPQSTRISPRSACPQALLESAPAPRPTTRVMSANDPEQEAILSGHAFAGLQIRSRPSTAVAGAKRGRDDDDDDDDDEDEPQLPASKRQLRPNQVLPPQRFARAPAGGGGGGGGGGGAATAAAAAPSSSPAAGASRSATGSDWTSSSSSGSDDDVSDNSSDESGGGSGGPKSDSGGRSGGRSGGSPSAGAGGATEDEELIPEGSYSVGSTRSPGITGGPNTGYSPGDPMEISDSDNRGGRRGRQAAPSSSTHHHRHHRHSHSHSYSSSSSSSSYCSTCYSSSESETGIVTNDPNLADPFMDAPPQPNTTTTPTTPTTPQRNPPARTSPLRTPHMRAPSRSPYRTPPPAYQKTPPVHSRTPRHPIEGPRPRRRSPGHSPLEGPRGRRPRRQVQPNETPPPSFLNAVGSVFGLSLGPGSGGRAATDADIRNARSPSTPEFRAPRGRDSPTQIRTPTSGMRGLLAPLGRLNFLGGDGGGDGGSPPAAPAAPRRNVDARGAPGRRGMDIYERRRAPFAEMNVPNAPRGRAGASGAPRGAQGGRGARGAGANAGGPSVGWGGLGDVFGDERGQTAGQRENPDNDMDMDDGIE
ncbi:hypothetical protein B0T13DRAFT_534090 [Neurospora crassa]|nr:hypothetical protein B0T13DRAFT_534090 [Neurospora crassa]